MPSDGGGTPSFVCVPRWFGGQDQLSLQRLHAFAEQKVTFGSCIVKSWLEARPH